MAMSDAWASHIFGSITNLENSLNYLNQNIKKMCHEKFQGPAMFLLDCKGFPK
jgi:hypothetical protein